MLGANQTYRRSITLVMFGAVAIGAVLVGGHDARASTISSFSSAQATYDAIWPDVQEDSQGGAGIVSSTASTLLATTYQTYAVNADASASANLASGGITVSGGAFLLGDVHLSADTVGGTGYSGSAARAFANLAEVLTVIPTTGFSGGTFDATVSMVMHGGLIGHAYADTKLTASTFVANDSKFASACSGTGNECVGLATDVLPFTLSLTIPVATSFPFLSVGVLSSVGANWEGGNLGNSYPIPIESGAADLANTGLLYVTLPEGFTFTSEIAQGVLVGSTISEPTSLVLFAMGLMGLGTLHRFQTGKR